MSNGNTTAIKGNTWLEWSQHVIKELKRLGEESVKINEKLDNHLQHTEKRVTEIETTLRNLKWIMGLLFAFVSSIFAMVLTLLLGG